MNRIGDYIISFQYLKLVHRGASEFAKFGLLLEDNLLSRTPRLCSEFFSVLFLTKQRCFAFGAKRP